MTVVLFQRVMESNSSIVLLNFHYAREFNSMINWMYVNLIFILFCCVKPRFDIVRMRICVVLFYYPYTE